MSRRAWRGGIGLAVVAVAGAGVAPASAVGGGAFTSPPTIGQVQARVGAAQRDAEAAAEAYDGMQVQIQSIQVRMGAAKNRERQQQAQVDAARHALGIVAAQRYREGDLAALHLLFSDNPDTMLAQSGLVATLSDREAAAVQALVDAQRQLQADEADQRAQLGRLQQAQAQADLARRTAGTRASAAKAELDRLTTTQRAQVEAISRGNVRMGLTCSDVTITYPSARVKAVLDYACVQVAARVPYVWGGASTRGFDCSGLTLMAWKQAGVNLPHFAASQYADGTHLPLSKAQPGDLAFFPDLGHVGIVLGNGLWIDAPHTGTTVRIDALPTNVLVARY